jgi:hypothetical protein
LAPVNAGGVDHVSLLIGRPSPAFPCCTYRGARKGLFVTARLNMVHPDFNGLLLFSL